MADSKSYPISIVLKAIDEATAPLREIRNQLKDITAPTRDLGGVLSGLGDKLSFGNVLAGLEMVGGVVTGLISGFQTLVGVVWKAALGLKGILDEFDNLGDTAERIGISATELAQFRYAAEQSGAEIGALDGGLESLNKSMGEFAARTGKGFKFIGIVSPNLQKELLAAKDLDQFLGVVADATKKLPTGKATKLLAAFGMGPEVLPLFKKGKAGIEELRKEGGALFGDLEGAAKAGGEFDTSMKKINASVLGVKAAIAENLGPVLTELSGEVTAFLGEHKAEIAGFIKDFGARIPGAVKVVVGVFKDIIAAIPGAISAIKNVVEGVKVVGPVFLAVGQEIWTFFKSLGEFIAVVAQGIVDAVEAVKDAANFLFGANSPGELREKYYALHPEARPAPFLVGDDRPPVTGANSTAQVNVTFENAPRSMRANTDPGSTADVSVDVGYQMSYLP